MLWLLSFASLQIVKHQRKPSSPPLSIPQVAAAVAAGARSLVLLAGSSPTPQLRAALAARFPSARLVVAAVSSSDLGNPPRLLWALYAARPTGAGPFAGALLPPPAAVRPPAVAAPAPTPGTHPSAGIPGPAGVAAAVSEPAFVAPAGAALEQLVASVVGDLLGAAAGAAPLAPDEPLMAAGVTSTLAVALTGRLEERLGVALPPTLVRAPGVGWGAQGLSLLQHDNTACHQILQIFPCLCSFKRLLCSQTLPALRCLTTPRQGTSGSSSPRPTPPPPCPSQRPLRPPLRPRQRPSACHRPLRLLQHRKLTLSARRPWWRLHTVLLAAAWTSRHQVRPLNLR
jgi:hypothetical protein